MEPNQGTSSFNHLIHVFSRQTLPKFSCEFSFEQNFQISLQIFVYAAMIFRGPAKICALNSSMIIVNRVAGKKTMGRVNGAAMTLQSGGRALGPLLSGTIWAISVSLNIPFQQYLGFILVGIALLCTQILYIGLQLPPES